jgi:hypothetical protein
VAGSEGGSEVMSLEFVGSVGLEERGMESGAKERGEMELRAVAERVVGGFRSESDRPGIRSARGSEVTVSDVTD